MRRAVRLALQLNRIDARVSCSGSVGLNGGESQNAGWVLRRRCSRITSSSSSTAGA